MQLHNTLLRIAAGVAMFLVPATAQDLSNSGSHSFLRGTNDATTAHSSRAYTRYYYFNNSFAAGYNTILEGDVRQQVRLLRTPAEAGSVTTDNVGGFTRQSQIGAQWQYGGYARLNVRIGGNLVHSRFQNTSSSAQPAISTSFDQTGNAYSGLAAYPFSPYTPWYVFGNVSTRVVGSVQMTRNGLDVRTNGGAWVIPTGSIFACCGTLVVEQDLRYGTSAGVFSNLRASWNTISGQATGFSGSGRLRIRVYRFPSFSTLVSTSWNSSSTPLL